MSLPITRFENHNSTANQAGRQKIGGDFIQHNSYHCHVFSPYNTSQQPLTSLPSQIDVATTGLLLSTLPSFISAAGHRKSRLANRNHSLKKWKFAVQYEEELTQLRLSLLGYIKAFIGKTTLAPELQLALCDHSKCESWDNPEVVKQTHTALGRSCLSYLEFVTRTCTILAKQVETSATSVPSVDTSVALLRGLNLRTFLHKPTSELGDQWSSISFSCSSSERVEILNEIRACNQLLLKLCKTIEVAGQGDHPDYADKAITVSGNRTNVEKWKNESAHAAFERREVVQKLFEVLQNTCKCVPSRTQDIGLRLRAFASNNEQYMESSFQMLLVFSQDNIYQLSAKMAKCISDTPANKKARFTEPDQKSSDPGLISTVSSMKPLVEICHEVAHAHDSAASLELFVNEHGEAYFKPQSVTSSLSIEAESQRVISLADIMSRLAIYSQKIWLRKEKAVLAIILAYSQLHLHDSPWLQFHWSSDTITFVDDSSVNRHQPQLAPHGQFLKPYAFSQPMRLVKAGVMRSSTHRLPPRRCAHLRALGVVLLELFLHESIHTGIGVNDRNGNRTETMDPLDVLIDHADDDGMTVAYYEAVHFCLAPTPSPGTRLFSFEDEGFRELYYQQVILNLQSHYTERFGEGNIFLANND